jgi:hypothetical protein
MLELAQPQLQMWARCRTTVFSFNVCIQREAVMRSSYSQGLQCHAPSPENYLSTLYATVYNKLTGGDRDWCVSIHAPSLPGPRFMNVWSSVYSLFWHLLSPSLRFIGQAHAGCKWWCLNGDLRVRWHARGGTLNRDLRVRWGLVGN